MKRCVLRGAPFQHRFIVLRAFERESVTGRANRLRSRAEALFRFGARVLDVALLFVAARAALEIRPMPTRCWNFQCASVRADGGRH